MSGWGTTQFNFGTPAPTTQPTDGGFNFGATTQQSGFSSFAAPAFTTSAFTSTAAAPAPDPDSIEGRIQAIEKAYNTTSSSCRFQYVFYNKVSPDEVKRHKKPDLANPRLWEQAERNNPDPNVLVPVLCVGFEDLQKRISAQDHAFAQYQKTLDAIRNQVLLMKQEQEAKCKLRIAALRKATTDLSHRVLSVISHIELQRAREFPLLPPEVDFRRKLEHIKRQLAKPAQFQARATELASLVRMQSSTRGAEADASQLAGAVDPDTLRKIHAILDTQRQQLAVLAAAVKKDTGDALLISEELGRGGSSGARGR